MLVILQAATEKTTVCMLTSLSSQHWAQRVFIVIDSHFCHGLLYQGMTSRISFVRGNLQTYESASDSEEGTDARATNEKALAIIMSSAMDWDLEFCDIEERFRCASMPVGVSHSHCSGQSLSTWKQEHIRNDSTAHQRLIALCLLGPGLVFLMQQ